MKVNKRICKLLFLKNHALQLNICQRKNFQKLSLTKKFHNNVRHTMVNPDMLANSAGLLLDLDIGYFKDLNFTV